MSTTHNPFPDAVMILAPQRSSDERGYFVETFNRKRFFDQTGFDGEFVQDNHSASARGVLRGLHYQVDPLSQGKLLRVIVGAIFDVAVDLRQSSATFGDWFGIELSAELGIQMWVPSGFGHGFLALSDCAEVAYKTTAYYSPEHERAIRWDDPDIGIEWPTSRVGNPQLSDRDSAALALVDAEVFQ